MGACKSAHNGEFYAKKFDRKWTGVEVFLSMAGMRRVKSRGRASAMKGRGAPKNVDDYLAAVPEPSRGALLKIRATIRSVLPRGATEVISYGMPAFKHKKVLVWYAAFSDHCSLFPTAAVIGEFKKELKGFTTSKGTIHFTGEQPLPSALVKQLVKARLKQID